MVAVDESNWSVVQAIATAALKALTNDKEAVASILSATLQLLSIRQHEQAVVDALLTIVLAEVQFFILHIMLHYNGDLYSRAYSLSPRRRWHARY